jgi:CDP-diacylglycerol--glycerol-3-phosphate 3-phosphatidyltransferase
MASHAAHDADRRELSEREGEAERARLSQGVGRFLRDLRTIPNLLSSFRVIGVIVAALLYLYGHRVFGMWLGFAAGTTDILDGYLARKLDQVTELGAILDRLCDLVFETTAFVCIVHFRLMSPAYFFAYLLREFVVLSARLYVAERGGQVPTNFFGRLKTDFFSLSFLVMFLVHSGVIGNADLGEALFKLAYAGIVGGVVCSYVSGAQYLGAMARLYGAKKS